MTFFALLTKELRLRMRRERSIWVIIVYILLMGLLGCLFIASSSSSSAYSYGPYSSSMLQSVGIQLYDLLTLVQLSLILFITPAFTSTAVNSEKERQTFDLLLCSKLSAFSLISGKLVAGLANALMLIAASLPIFSLVFFFGGISLTQFLSAQLVFITTTILAGTFGLFCSTLFKRPAISTVITYTVGLLWIVLPVILYYMFLIYATYRNGNPFATSPHQLFSPSDIFIWHPVAALTNTYPPFATGSVGSIPPYTFSHPSIPAWLIYTILNIIAATVFFLLSMRIVKPRQRGLFRRGRKSPAQPQVTATA